MVPLVCLIAGIPTGDLRPPPAADPILAAAGTDHLSRAADCLQRGDRATAAAHLGRHVRTFPDQLMVRAHLAELLFGEQRFREASDQFERFVADAQMTDGPPRTHLAHAHTRLMQAAEATGDSFREPLHRGIALAKLADRWPADEPTTRDALARAAASLREAAAERPTDPRPWAYLADVYSRLGQVGPAAAAAQAARERPPAGLTAAEKRSLLGRP
jgi:uncharacterized protein HemY